MSAVSPLSHDLPRCDGGGEIEQSNGKRAPTEADAYRFKTSGSLAMLPPCEKGRPDTRGAFCGATECRTYQPFPQGRQPAGCFNNRARQVRYTE